MSAATMLRKLSPQALRAVSEQIARDVVTGGPPSHAAAAAMQKVLARHWDHWRPGAVSRSVTIWFTREEYAQLREDLLGSGISSLHGYIKRRLGVGKRGPGRPRKLRSVP